MNQPPAFQLYARDWLSGDARMMSHAEKGVFIDLLCFAWLEEGLPADPERLARVVGLSGRDFEKLWPAIAPNFTADDEGRLRNPRQEVYRAELKAFKDERSEAGKRGAAARWGNS